MDLEQRIEKLIVGKPKEPVLLTGVPEIDQLICLQANDWLEITGSSYAEAVAKKVFWGLVKQCKFALILDLLCSDTIANVIDLDTKILHVGSNKPEIVLPVWQEFVGHGDLLWVNGIMALDTDTREEILGGFIPDLLAMSQKKPFTVFSHWETWNTKKYASVKVIRQFSDYTLRILGEEPPFFLSYMGKEIELTCLEQN